MSSDDGFDELVQVIEGMRHSLAELQKRLRAIERALRHEGFGPEDLDDEDDD